MKSTGNKKPQEAQEECLRPVRKSAANEAQDEDDEENIVIDMADEDDDEDEEQEEEQENNNSKLARKRQHLDQKAEIQFAVGDLIWFDPNQLGYCIPGKIVDVYRDLNVLTIEGCGQPLALDDSPAAQATQLHHDDARRRNKLLQRADEQLQLYELADSQSISSIKLREPIQSELGFHDLVELEELSLESVIWNLKLRFKHDLIYTRCGRRILLSVNPHKPLADLYDLRQVRRHQGTRRQQQLSSGQQQLRWLLAAGDQLEQATDSVSSRAHIFQLAESALKQLQIERRDQCFLLQGDCGAGKTEACKQLLQYFAAASESPADSLVTEQILESIQILESFGNARTQTNDNSSRFGKLVELHFQLDQMNIRDSKIMELNLLDKSRIVYQAEGERNYHVFYELLAGLSSSEKEKYGLQTSDKYFYLNQGASQADDRQLSGGATKNDADDFGCLLSSMQILGFNHHEQDTIFRILATILHLGNVYFHRKLLGSQAAEDSLEVEGVEVGSDTEIRWVSHLLQIQFDSIVKCLTVGQRDFGPKAALGGDEQLTSCVAMPLNIDQALDARDSIARTLYTCLFKWLVQRINVMINATQQADHQQLASNKKDETNGEMQIYLSKTRESLCEFQPDKLAKLHKSAKPKQRTSEKNQSAIISILDTFGFENNSIENNFEQLCANYAAEFLHHQARCYLIKMELLEYEREQIKWRWPVAAPEYPTRDHLSEASYDCKPIKSNSIVNLISKKPLGILPLLDDECNFPKASDQSFAEKCHHNHALNDNYQCARLTNANCHEFGIRHFGQANRMVWYQVEGFLEKNRDSIRADVLELLMSSKMGIVVDMLSKLAGGQQSNGTASSQPSTLNRVTGTISSRTSDGRFVSMKPRQATVAARYLDALHNNHAISSLNCSSSSKELAASHCGPTTDDSSRPEPWFVICLRPNRSKTAQIFDVPFVQSQLTAMNVFELVQISKCGLTVHMTYSHFMASYKCLVPNRLFKEGFQLKQKQLLASLFPSAATSLRRAHKQLAKSREYKLLLRDFCRSIIEYKLHQSQQLASIIQQQQSLQYQCGQTKMFLNEKLHQQLDQWRLSRHLTAIETLQKSMRMFFARRQYLEKRRAAILIQAQVRAHLARSRYLRLNELVVRLQRSWRRRLRAKQLETSERRRRQRLADQMRQFKQVQTKHWHNASPLRFRLDPNHQRHQLQADDSSARSSLDVPRELEQLYRLQASWLPSHTLANVHLLDLKSLVECERKRQPHSVPFVVVDDELLLQSAGCWQTQEKILEVERQMNELIEADEQTGGQLEFERTHSLACFLVNFYPVDVPQFGYSRAPITKPFTWALMQQQQEAELSRANLDESAVELVKEKYLQLECNALAIYKLILRFIDTDQSQQTQGLADLFAQEPSGHVDDQRLLQELAKFKLIVDYITYLCLMEPLLRDELYLQLCSQIWRNPRPESVENIWKLFLSCLFCFEPTDLQLVRLMARFAFDNCSHRYRHQVCSQLCAAWRRRLDTAPTGQLIEYHPAPQLRRRLYPTTLLEYLLASQRVSRRISLQVSCDLDEFTLGQEEAEMRRMASSTAVCLHSQTTAEQLAQRLLKCRSIGRGIDHFGWSLEIQHEGAAANELSCRLRGDQFVFDHLARIELLPELVKLIDSDSEAIEFELLNREISRLIAKLQRNRFSSASGNILSRKLNEMNSNRFSALFSGRQSWDANSNRTSGYAQLSSTIQSLAASSHCPDGGQYGLRGLRDQPTGQRNRRSMSMQELQHMTRSPVYGHQYAASRVHRTAYGGMSPPACCTEAADLGLYRQSALQRRTSACSSMAPPPPAGGRRRSATPNSFQFAGGREQQRRLSSSAYGSHYSCSNQYYGPEEDKYSRAVQQRMILARQAAELEAQRAAELHHERGRARQLATGPSRRRSLSSSSRTTACDLSQRTELTEYSRRQQPNHNAAAPSDRTLAKQPNSDSAIGQQQQHYASSAVSDTSETMSLASHVKRVKKPKDSGDLDRYLDDLFNPLLDEDQGETSDARSLAPSILIGDLKSNGCLMGDSSEAADCTTELAASQETKRQLSPTFESLIKSLKTGDCTNQEAPLPPPPPQPDFGGAKQSAGRLVLGRRPSEMMEQPVGRLKISSEMRNKLEQLTNSSAAPQSNVMRAKKLLEDSLGHKENTGGGASKLMEQRRHLLENQLLGTRVAEPSSCRSSTGSRVLAVKQQLAAAAGVALSSLADPQDTAALQRYSSASFDEKSAREEQEFGPQTRAAINQRSGSATINEDNQQQQQPAKTLKSTRGSDLVSIGRLGGKKFCTAPDSGHDGGGGEPLSWIESDDDEQHRRQWEVSKTSTRHDELQQQQQQQHNKQANDGDEWKCLTYANVDWHIKVRKEFFRPSETYEQPADLQLIFAQLVADVFRPRQWTRLSAKERAALKSMMKEHSIGYSPSLAPVGRLQQVKRELVRMARTFGLYFTRTYEALNLAACLVAANDEQSALDDDDDERSFDCCRSLAAPSRREPKGQRLKSNNNGGNFRNALGSNEWSLNSFDDDDDDEQEDAEDEEDDDCCRWTNGDKSNESQDGAAHHDSRHKAIKLVQHLRARGQLGLSWFELVAIHHTGLRLVSLANETSGGCDGLGLESAPTSGYNVLETLKFRDMTQVVLVSELVVLVQMSDDRKSWLISSSQANQLATLLNQFHLDYNQQTGSQKQQQATRNKLIATQQQNTSSRIATQPEKQSAPTNLQQTNNCDKITQTNRKHKGRRVTRLEQDALLAADDVDYVDYIEKRQAANRIGELRPLAHPDDALADHKPILPDSLANSNQATHSDSLGRNNFCCARASCQFSAPPPPAHLLGRPPPAAGLSGGDKQPGVWPTGHQRRRRSNRKRAPGRGAAPAEQLDFAGQCPGYGCDDCGRGHHSSGGTSACGGSAGHHHDAASAREPADWSHHSSASTARVKASGKKERKGKSSLWQNSLTRMSNTLSIFSYSNSTAGGSQKRQQQPRAHQSHAHQDDPQHANELQLQLDAWIESKMDLESDDENEIEQKNGADSTHDDNEKLNSRQDGEKPRAESKASSSLKDEAEDESRHSMLQFALYNFREAIEKYSLALRIQPDQRQNQHQQQQQQAADDNNNQSDNTSTLRGSLKLIENMRLGAGDKPPAAGTAQPPDAERSSNGPPSGGNIQSNDWTWRELAEMVKFTRVPIKRPLLKLNAAGGQQQTQQLERRALECFAAIMQYMGDLDGTHAATADGKHQHQLLANDVECVYLILISCHNYPQLRDEIYCQLIKQTTNNRSERPDSCLRGWRLFSMLAAYFACSNQLRPYLVKYLESAAYDKRRAYHSVASLCLQNLRKTFRFKGRKNVPSVDEISATTAGRNSKRQIYRLPGGTERVINTKSTTVVDDIINEICVNMLNVTDKSEILEYSLYCIADGDFYTMPLSRDEYILDITTELIKNQQQYFLIFCRSIWYYPLHLDSKLYIEVIFNQIAPDYLEGLLLVLPLRHEQGSAVRSPASNHRDRLDSTLNLSPDSHSSTTVSRTSSSCSPTSRQGDRDRPLRGKQANEIARIAALLHRASGADQPPRKEEIKFLLPKPIVLAIKQRQRDMKRRGQTDNYSTTINISGSSSSSASSVSSQQTDLRTANQGHAAIGAKKHSIALTNQAKWIELVQSNWNEMSTFDTLDAKAQFLDIVRHWPLFGSSFFAIKLIQRDLIQPSDYILALNKLGIQMLDMISHETVHKYHFNEVISTRKVRSEDGCLFLDLKCGDFMKRNIIRIQTDQAHEISRLIKQYIDIELSQSNKATSLVTQT